MSDAWTTVTLGDVIAEERDKRRVEPDVAYPLAGVLGFGRGVLLRDAVRGADMSAQFLYRIRAGQLMYSRLKAFEGAFALVSPEADGRYVSNEFPTFDVDTSVALPEFIALYLARPRVWEELQAGSEGMGARRERLQPADFLDLELDLPPLDEQARIVSSVAVVDRAVHAYQQQGSAARKAHAAAREDLIEATDFDRVPLSEVVLSVRGGKSPKCLDRPPTSNEYGVLKVSAIRDGQFRPQEAKALPEGMAPAAPSVHAGDLLYSRANTAALVGAVCRVERDYPRLLLCDKTMRLTVDGERIDPDFLIEAVGTSAPREHIETTAGGTSESMKNISQDGFLAAEVALPPLDEQHRIVAALSSLRRVRTAAERRVADIQRFRGVLVEELLTPATAPEELQPLA